MLDALRDRDPAEQWESAGATLPPVVSPAVPAAADLASDDLDWRRGTASSPAGLSAAPLAAPPTARLAQQEPLVPAEPMSGTPGLVEDSPSISPLTEPPAIRDDETAFQPIARTPDELRKIDEILPYHDYSPDPSVDDPCLYLCPRPDGMPCKEYAPGEEPPCPVELGLGSQPFVPRSMPPSVFAWKASNVSHNPLYFEDPQLERYGHTYHDCVQPFVSLGRFSVQVVGLPYQMALDPPCKEVYALGYYRPGEPAPKLQHQVPLNARAAALAAVFYTGVGFALP